ncbi:hypothetical protein MATL_G00137330 [Megalops atlanticus]|uniref:Uncharacterized protein n=1 Tax=Megalops atlanticus TaxID=7932 RepID=A0A9D3PT01_MEGAT|nr:hypothetical protein MATL_G00137330 [Megalops atlanticus]
MAVPLYSSLSPRSRLHSSLRFCPSHFHKRQPGVSRGRRFCPACSSLYSRSICIHSPWIGVSNSAEGKPRTPRSAERSRPAEGSSPVPKGRF